MKVVVRGLTKVYPTSQGDIRAIGGINLEVRDREFFGIIGPTGCGKTTLLHVIGRLEAPSTGTVEFIGEQHGAGDLGRSASIDSSVRLADFRRSSFRWRGAGVDEIADDTTALADHYIFFRH